MILPNLIKIISTPTAGYDMGWGADVGDSTGGYIQSECDRCYSFESWYAHKHTPYHRMTLHNIPINPPVSTHFLIISPPILSSPLLITSPHFLSSNHITSYLLTTSFLLITSYHLTPYPLIHRWPEAGFEMSNYQPSHHLLSTHPITYLILTLSTPLINPLYYIPSIGFVPLST